MATQALIVDQASGVRSLFTRVLRALNCVTHEAADGGEAIDVLQSVDIGLAVIEAETALLSGLDLLRILRESEQYAHLPVVIVTDGTDQATLTEMVRLGAADCLTKPFDVELIKGRLQRIIRSISATGALQSSPSSESGVTATALIVDRNAECRQFVAGCLSGLYATTQVDTGVEALRACQVRKFAALVMGTDTGLLGPRALARRLRRQTALDDMRIVLVAPRSDSLEFGDTMAFDGVLPRTFVPEEFTRQFRQLVTGPRDRCAGIITALRPVVASATALALGMLARVDVSPIDDAAAGDETSALEATVVMAFPTERVQLRLTLRAAEPAAERMAAAMGRPADDPDAGLRVLGELVDAVAGRVRTTMGTDTSPVTISAPGMRRSPAGEGGPSRDTVLPFASSDRTLRFELRLSAADTQFAAA